MSDRNAKADSSGDLHEIKRLRAELRLRKDEYVERQEWAAEQAMAVIKEKDAEIERLRTSFYAISQAKEAYRIMLDEKVEEIERLCDIIETQEDALEEFHTEIERLRAELERIVEIDDNYHSSLAIHKALEIAREALGYEHS